MTKLDDLSGETTIWIVRLTLRDTFGYSLYGGATDEHEDRFLMVEGRLVLAASPSDLWAKLPSISQSSFGRDSDEAFATFRAGSQKVNPPDILDDSIAHFNFNDALSALSKNLVFEESGSSRIFQCLNAAIDLGEQLGTESLIFQTARGPALSTLYKALWGTVDQGDVEPDMCLRDMHRLIELIEGLIDR
ncbi:hypothetical protein Lfu02_78060 [Longispora fulva]|uniref:Uncharacterized protein n=1 Tax=Longispora fulva TaxID=619741 RepID=A0A8J7KK47_9ACTN|nr:hypothetical protein [Longispora fulva]MBG6136251.1 hypothetical protein [Longispora fulva]GIG63434.1 hypothetical protein Lfu02_78060 [Longispora fulva]